MTMHEINSKLKIICEKYVSIYNIKTSDDWFLLKIQEELGELTSAHLKLTDRGRKKDFSSAELEQNFQDEIADVLAMTLLLAQHKGIDIEKALQNKWFKYLETAQENK